MAKEGMTRRKALKERLQARRRAKEAELDKSRAGERERCDQDADLTCLEELEAEVRRKKQYHQGLVARHAGLEQSTREIIRHACLEGGFGWIHPHVSASIESVSTYRTPASPSRCRSWIPVAINRR